MHHSSINDQSKEFNEKERNKADFSIKCFSNVPPNRESFRSNRIISISPPSSSPLKEEEGEFVINRTPPVQTWKQGIKYYNGSAGGVANTFWVMFARWHSLLHTFRKYWTNVCIAYAPTRINKCLMKIVSSRRLNDEHERLNEQTGRIGAIIRPPREKKEEERWTCWLLIYSKKKKKGLYG